MMESKDSHNEPTSEMIPLQHPGEKSTSSQFKHSRGRNLLLCYLRGKEWLLLSIGTCFAFMHGVCFPLITLILGHMTDILLSQAEQRCNISNSSLSYLSQYDEETDSYEELSIENLLQNTSSGFVNPQQLLDIFSSEPGSVSQEEFEDLLSLLSAILGVTVLVAAFLQPFCWELCSSRQLHHLLEDLFCQLLCQNMAWYDYHKDKDLAQQLFSNVDQIHHGTGARVGMLIQYSATCASGFIIAFIANWRLTVFILPLFFQCLVAPHLLDKVYLHMTSKRYHEAGQIAEEMLSNFQPGNDTEGSAVEINCYKEAVQRSQKTTLKGYYGIVSCMLAVYLAATAAMAVALWQNWKLIEMGCLAPGAVATVFFSVTGGMLSINKILPLAATVMSATQSAAALTVVTDMASVENGTELAEKTKITGKVKFKDVSFSYPLESKKQMLHNVNFEIGAGQSVAFMDVSGRIPTTVLDLLLGFYKPTAGEVLFDGTLGCPRSAFAVFNFDPKLYTCLSVLDNIQLGQKNVHFSQMVQVAINVGVHGYIPGLPMGYDTMVGEQFSTDLKQRITLARAVMRDPKILIIDDITSCHVMDIHDNRIMTDILCKVMAGRTSIILSQRLPIIQNANIIHVLQNGTLCKSGSHTELMASCQLYHNWVKAQERDKEDIDTAKDTMQQNSTEGKHSKMSESLSPQLAEQDAPTDSTRCSMICLYSPDWLLLIFCMLGNICTGLGLPVFARLFGDIFVPREELPRTSQLWGYTVLILAVLLGFTSWIQSVTIATCNEKMLSRLRIQTFSALLLQAEKEMDTNIKKLQHIHTQLFHNLPLARMATTARICEIAGAGVSLVAAMAAAFLHGWKMEMVLLLVFPAIALAFCIKIRTVEWHQQKHHRLMQPANDVVTECIQKIRTLRALGGEEIFKDLYSKRLIAPYNARKKYATVYALVYALSEAGVHVLYAASFKFGFFLIRSGLMDLVKVYRVFFALGICIISMSHLLAYRHEWIAAGNTLQKLFQLVRGQCGSTERQSKSKC